MYSFFQQWVANAVINTSVPSRDVFQWFRKRYFISEACRRSERKGRQRERKVVSVRCEIMFLITIIQTFSRTNIFGCYTTLSAEFRQRSEMQPNACGAPCTVHCTALNTMDSLIEWHNTIHYNMIRFDTRRHKHNTTQLSTIGRTQYNTLQRNTL